jgi:hypothetical protein
MNFKDLMLTEEFAQKKFTSSLVRPNIPVYVIKGEGNAVDVHSTGEAINIFKSVIKKHINFPSTFDFKIAGRFGNDSREWRFTDIMNADGHPRNWIPDSRGYYVIYSDAIFLFPKNNDFFAIKPNGFSWAKSIKQNVFVKNNKVMATT